MWHRRADVLWRAAPGYLVLCSVEGEVVEFGGPAADVWQELAEPREVQEIATTLADRYDVGSSPVHADVAAFISELSRRDLVEELARGEV